MKINGDGYVGPIRSELGETTMKFYTNFDFSPLYESDENAIKAKLRELGWVKLEPGEVVARRVKCELWCESCDEPGACRSTEPPEILVEVEKK